MPELPEVEMYRRGFEAGALGQKVIDIEVQDSKVLTCSEEELNACCLNQSLESTERIGKYLFINTSASKTLMIHFGMTASLEFFSQPEEEPRFSRLIFQLESGIYLAYRCPRKFGRLDVGESVAAFKEKKKLSKDALQLSFEELNQNLGQSRRAIKTALLDQSVAAGVGNWIVDEVLFQAKVHPSQRTLDLNEAQRRDIHQAMMEVLELAIREEGDYNSFPPHYILHRRKDWTEVEAQACANCPPKMEEEYLKVGGRASYICPHCQILES